MHYAVSISNVYCGSLRNPVADYSDVIAEVKSAVATGIAQPSQYELILFELQRINQACLCQYNL